MLQYAREDDSLSINDQLFWETEKNHDQGKNNFLCVF